MVSEDLPKDVKCPIDQTTNEWLPNQDTVLPIDGKDIPNFKAWVNWHGFQYDRTTGQDHDGFDFAAYETLNGKIVFGLPASTRIRAVADGTVVQIRRNWEEGSGGYGCTLSLEHGRENSGLFSGYTHIVPQVAEFTKVKKGDVIGTLYQDPDGKEGRLVHLHLKLVNGWDVGGSLKARTQDPKVLDSSIYTIPSLPQGKANFTVPLRATLPIQIANFQQVKI